MLWLSFVLLIRHVCSASSVVNSSQRTLMHNVDNGVSMQCGSSGRDDVKRTSMAAQTLMCCPASRIALPRHIYPAHKLQFRRVTCDIPCGVRHLPAAYDCPCHILVVRLRHDRVAQAQEGPQRVAECKALASPDVGNCCRAQERFSLLLSDRLKIAKFVARGQRP